MVSRKDEEGRILVVEEEKKKAKKIHDRTYDIIMSENRSVISTSVRCLHGQAS